MNKLTLSKTINNLETSTSLNNLISTSIENYMYAVEFIVTYNLELFINPFSNSKPDIYE